MGANVSKPVTPTARHKTSSVVGDVGSSAITQVLVVVGNVAALRLAASLMSPDAVGEYALVRRVLVFLAPTLLLGFGVGLPRTLGRVGQDTQYGAVIALSGGVIGFGVAAMTALLLVMFPTPTARLLFGADQHENLVRLLAPLLLGHQLFLLAYGVLRGQLRIRHANALQLVMVGLLPLIAVALVGRHGVDAVLLGLGIASTLIAASVAARLFGSALRRRTLARGRDAIRELVTYSLPRVPGELAATGLYALGPILAAHELDIGAAGLLAIGVSLITVLSAAFTPLGVALLPRMSRRFAAEGGEWMRRRAPLLCGLALYCAALLAITCSVFGNVWLRWILGEGFQFESQALVLLSIAAASNIVFVVLRSVLDAAFARPINAMHASIALVCMLGAWFGGRILLSSSPFELVCGAIAVAFVTLASLTLVAIWRRGALPLTSRSLWRWSVTTVAVAVAAVGLERLAVDAGMLALAAAQVGVFAVWLGTLALVGVRWPFELVALLRQELRRRARGTLDTLPAAVRTRHVLCTTVPEESAVEVSGVTRELHS